MYFLTSFELAALTSAFTAEAVSVRHPVAITLAYGESLPSITMASFADDLASTAKFVLMTDASTSGSVLGSCAASISFIFIFFGIFSNVPCCHKFSGLDLYKPVFLKQSQCP